MCNKKEKLNIIEVCGLFPNDDIAENGLYKIVGKMALNALVVKAIKLQIVLMQGVKNRFVVIRAVKTSLQKLVV